MSKKTFLVRDDYGELAFKKGRYHSCRCGPNLDQAIDSFSRLDGRKITAALSLSSGDWSTLENVILPEEFLS